MAEPPGRWVDGLRLLLVTPGDGSPNATDELVARALEGGVSSVLLRERQLPAPERRALYARLVTRCRSHGALALVSREAGLARELGAHGVHLGHGGPDLDSCRAAAPGLIVSRSAHWPLNDDDRRADWVTLSPCFATPSSLPRPLLSAAQLRAALAHERLGPVVALGGLDATRVAGLPDGMAGVAVLRALCDASDPTLAARRLRRAVDQRWWPGPLTAHDVQRGLH
ncbi:MAG: thiamine phosphate synthase [Planctomycetota bacterium]|nr:MAG: thiamine phosphate synthase [Planctomycetota bacterium]